MEMRSHEPGNTGEMTRLLGYLREDPDNMRLRADIFDRTLASGQHNEAQRQVDWVLSRKPVDFEWRHRMAVLDMACGRLESAGLLLQSLIDEGQSDPVVAFNRAYVEFLQGRYEVAVARLQELRRQRSLPSQGLALLLRCMHRLGSITEAVEFFVECLVESPTPDAYGAAALLAIDAGQLVQAEQWASRAMAEGSPSHEALISLGTVALAHQDAQRALHFLDEAQRRFPTDGRTWSAIGLAQMLRNDLPSARTALVHAVKFMPSHIGTWHCLGWCEIFLKDFPAAKAAFVAAVALDRSFGESHGGVAAVLALQGDRQGAESELRRARRLNPKSLSAQFARSVLDGTHADFNQFRQVAQIAFEAHRGPDGKTLSSLVFGARA